EHGSAYELLVRLKAALDPNGIMNPGTILPLDAVRVPEPRIEGA
ncbi:FAD-linked oxidase C-terminal domain-containing protein, partial [Bacillus cereus group sp. BC17]